MSAARVGPPPRVRAFIGEVGVCCPLGLNSLQATTAARAGKLEPRGSALRDRRKHLVGLVRSRFLPDALTGLERLVRLGAPALREAGAALTAPVPLFLGIAEGDRPDVGADVEAGILSRLAAASGVAIDEGRSRVIRAGHASFAGALEAALERLEAASSPPPGAKPGGVSSDAPAAVLVGCIDSFMHPEAIAWLDAAHRLHAPGTEDGIVPSEAAAFALVLAGGADLGALLARVPTPLAAVRWARTDADASVLVPDGPILGETMTSLVREALSALSTPPAWIFTDLDEMHRVREWSRVELRCQPALDRAEHQRVPDLFGDVGAATGALAAAYACRGWSIGGAPRGVMLAALSSDGPTRGVIVLQEGSAFEEAR